VKKPAGERRFDDLTRFTLSREHIRTLTEDYCRKHQVVLLGGPGGGGSSPVPLGMLDVTEDAAALEVERKTGRRVRRIQLNAFELDTALAYGFSAKPSGEGEASSITLDIGTGRLLLDCDREIRFERGQMPSSMVTDLLSQAVRRRASDVHIETYVTDVDVRLRIDGGLQQVATPFSHANVRKVCSYIKVLAEMDIAERRQDQDGRIATVYRDEDGNARQIDLRVSVLPGPHGSDVVLRVLDEKRISISLDRLGLEEATCAKLREIIERPGGIMIVAGPTASGKTTTLYSAIREINTDENKILTVEDPIEYEIPKVNQKQVNTQMSFAAYSRAFMRQNPDVLMIGEVRDEETASIALRAAQMGHLVFTTLHARDVRSALSRLLVLSGDRTLAASGLVGVLSQRLVRRICPECSEPYAPDPTVLAQLPPLPAGIAHVRGKGCPACAGTGYKRQVGVFELLAFNDQMRDQVWRGQPLDLGSVPGFRSMIDDAIAKVAAGITTVEEVRRKVPLAE